jgi:hypothetical protein
MRYGQTSGSVRKTCIVFEVLPGLAWGRKGCGRLSVSGPAMLKDKEHAECTGRTRRGRVHRARGFRRLRAQGAGSPVGRGLNGRRCL